MIEDSLAQLDAVMKKIETAAPPNKDVLLRLMKELRKEMMRLDLAQHDQAASVARFTDAAAHESVRKSRVASLRKLALDGLAQSVSGFEKSHPRLVETIGEIGRELSSLGI